MYVFHVYMYTHIHIYVRLYSLHNPTSCFFCLWDGFFWFLFFFALFCFLLEKLQHGEVVFYTDFNS